jgi:hypothetical protein
MELKYSEEVASISNIAKVKLRTLREASTSCSVRGHRMMSMYDPSVMNAAMRGKKDASNFESSL